MLRSPAGSELAANGCAAGSDSTRQLGGGEMELLDTGCLCEGETSPNAAVAVGVWESKHPRAAQLSALAGVCAGQHLPQKS